MPFAVYALYKSYGGVEVLKGVDLSVADGEIHALLGANGAGKSTLIKCLSGAIQPDSGGLMVGTERYSALTPKTAARAGVAVIYQDPALASSLSAADNIFLGRELRRGPFVRYAEQRKVAAHWLKQLDPSLDPRTKLSSLGNAGVQTVEIARSLSMEPKVLILDEPTAALSEREADNLAQQLIQLKQRKLPMLYVTHRLSEVFAFADKVTVLRGGRAVLSGPVSEFTQDQIVAAIAGQDVSRDRAPRREFSGTSLFVQGLVAPGIGPVDFEVRKGEVLGVFGLVGSGRTELLETLFGARTRHSGTVRLDGEIAQPASPAQAVAKGIALIPSDRLHKSVVPRLPALDNMILPSLRKVATGFLHSRKKARAAFYKATDPLHLSPRRHDLEIQRYSGGNQQKVVVARWLNALQACRLLLVDEPTQGVDVGARKDIYDALRRSAEAGNSLIVTSSEADELLQLADRVMVLSHGRCVGMLSGDELQEDRLLSLAHGFHN